jgi:tetratricopeptide (TPR) repeat protein
MLLYRETSMVLMWDGQGYSGFYLRSPAKYRIQAVWDGDYLTHIGHYKDALRSYDLAINDPTLLTWSPDFLSLEYPLCENCANTTPVPPNPILDEHEPARLAAYSLYRIMLLYVLDGDIQKAESVYQSIQQNYRKNNIAYAELAEAFWNEYSANNDLGKACQKAVLYAAAHQEAILHPIGRQTHGWVTPIYEPENICP